MVKMRGVGLAACLFGLLLAGCSPPPPPPPRLTTPAADKAAKADKTETKSSKAKGKDANAPEDETQAYKSAINACRAQASQKTMGTILAILSRLRPGAYNANYAACMKTKGYDIGE
jgi:hypothetical protein